MAVRASRWLKTFEQFVDDIRISSKESVSQDERGVKLELWESQRRFMHELGRGLDDGIHAFNCLKSRQLGITTISLALVDVFWPAMHPNLIGCLVTDTEKNREVNRALIEKYVNSFPDGYFGESFRIVKSNRQMLQFSNGSRLDLLVAGVKKKAIAWGEGVGYAYAHLTEVASYGDVEGLKSLEEGFAQNNPHRLFVYESTAKGYNHWCTKWASGVNDPLSQRSFFIGWWAGDNNTIPRKDPRFAQWGLMPATYEEKEKISEVARLYGHKITPEQLAWIRWKENAAGAEQDLLDQNQPWTSEQAFVKSGSSFFAMRVVNEDIKKLREKQLVFKGYRYEVDGDFFNFKMVALDPEHDDIDQVELKVWEEPVENGQYVIGFDPAYGRNDHKDGHAIFVARCFADRIVQVAEYNTADVETKHAAWVLFHLAAAYRNCMVNIELGGPGQMIMPEFDHLRQLLSVEMNAHRTEAKGWADAGANVRYYLYHRPDSFGAGYMANFEATWRTTGVMMHQLRGCYVSNELEIRSMALLREMSLVVRDDNGHIGAPESRDPNMKDDRVFAMALAVKAWLDWVRKDMLAQGKTYEVVMKEESGETTPVSRTVNNIVMNFLRSVEEEAGAEPEPPRWMQDQGLA